MALDANVSSHCPYRREPSPRRRSPLFRVRFQRIPQREQLPRLQLRFGGSIEVTWLASRDGPCSGQISRRPPDVVQGAKRREATTGARAFPRSNRITSRSVLLRGGDKGIPAHGDLAVELGRFGLDPWISSGEVGRRSFETAMRAVLLWSVLVSEVGTGQPHVTWVVDEDEIAANDLRHTDLLQLAGRVSQHFIRRNMGALCVCTTASEGKSVAFEDFNAIADIAAGSLCEAVNKWKRSAGNETAPDSKYDLTGHSAKCDLINDWFFYPSSDFRRVAVLVDREERGMTIQRITLQS